MAEHDTPEMIAAIRAGCNAWSPGGHSRSCVWPECPCTVAPKEVRAAIAAYEAARTLLAPPEDGNAG